MSSKTAETAVLQFIQAGKTYPPQRTPLRQLWGYLRGGNRQESDGYTALQSVSFDILSGQTLGIVGLNGAGKSTLLQLAAGTLRPSQGQVSSKGRIAALLELGSGFNPEATGYENIFLYAATLGLTREQVNNSLDEICSFSGLAGEHLGMPVKTYSSGMQVRLAFAVATSVEPDILIVDEALSVGDGVFAKRSFDRVMQLRERGTALLLCSHALFHIDLFCERTLWLDKGQIRSFGATSEVLPRYHEYLDSLNGGGDGNAVVGTPQVAALEGMQRACHPELVRLLRTEVRLDGVSGVHLRGRSLSSLLQIDVWLQVSQDEPHPRAALVLSSDSGKIIGSCMCDTRTIAAQDIQGHAHIRYLWEQLPINKGKYRVGLYLLSDNGQYVYEWLDPLATLELEHDGVHQGAWLLPGNWSPSV